MSAVDFEKAKAFALKVQARTKAAPPQCGAAANGPKGVQIGFEVISPTIAADWLRANTANRRLRPHTVARYARDMRLGAWMLNHQGIAFRSDGVLLDGQHRLQAIIESGVSVTMLVSRGWPERPADGTTTTLDTVDTGAARTLADLLELQHGQENPRVVTSSALVVAEIVCWPRRDRVDHGALSMASLLVIVGQIPKSFAFVAAKRPKLPGLRHASLIASIAILHNHHPRAADFILGSLMSGAGLAVDSPLLQLRNWLLNPRRSTGGPKMIVAATVATMLFEHLDGHSAKDVSHDFQDLRRLAELLPLKAITAIRSAFGLPAELPTEPTTTTRPTTNEQEAHRPKDPQ